MTTEQAGMARPASNQMLPWRSWQDWTTVVLGVYLALAPVWTEGAPPGWFVTLGVLMVVVGLWALGARSAPGPEWTQIVLGAGAFLSPWIGSFADSSGAGWTAWVVGVAVVVLAGTAMNQAKAG